MSQSNSSSLYTPRILRIEPQQPDGSFTDNIVDLVLIDMPAEYFHSFVFTKSNNGEPEDNILKISYTGSFSDPVNNNDTVTVLLSFTNPIGSPFYDVEVESQQTGAVKKGHPAPSIIVSRDEKPKVFRKQFCNVNTAADCFDYQIHPIVIKSGTNPDQFFSGGMIHVPDNQSITDNSGGISDAFIQLIGGPPGPSARSVQFAFRSNYEMVWENQNPPPSSTKYTHINVIYEDDSIAYFIKPAQGNDPAIDLYTNNPDIITL